MANIDTEGCLQITDRLKDVIKTGGEWVSSLELESLISQHPGVSEVAVIALRTRSGASAHGTRRAKDWPRFDGHGGRHTDSRACLRRKGRDFQVRGTHAVRLIEAIDKTSVGKCDKKLLRKNTDDSSKEGRTYDDSGLQHGEPLRVRRAGVGRVGVDSRRSATYRCLRGLYGRSAVDSRGCGACPPREPVRRHHRPWLPDARSGRVAGNGGGIGTR